MPMGLDGCLTSMFFLEQDCHLIVTLSIFSDTYIICTFQIASGHLLLIFVIIGLKNSAVIYFCRIKKIEQSKCHAEFNLNQKKSRILVEKTPDGSRIPQEYSKKSNQINV